MRPLAFASVSWSSRDYTASLAPISCGSIVLCSRVCFLVSRTSILLLSSRRRAHHREMISAQRSNSWKHTYELLKTSTFCGRLIAIYRTRPWNPQSAEQCNVHGLSCRSDETFRLIQIRSLFRRDLSTPRSLAVWLNRIKESLNSITRGATPSNCACVTQV